MEIEVQVTKTIEVEVDVTVTPVDGRLPGPPGPALPLPLQRRACPRTDRRQGLGERPTAFPAKPACRHAFRIL
jgi:hypothetical protein